MADFKGNYKINTTAGVMTLQVTTSVVEPYGFIAVPVPTLETFRFRFWLGIQAGLYFLILFTFLITFLFLTFVFHFMLYPDLNPVPGPDPECIPVPLRKKETVPVLAPQHYF